ncbi:DUF2157 domain-containing protein [Neptuniibacter sp.]|uniref:DUF2157 domain-containing protein n=1 Tax=Neptuniibacter sp. TaxID=1962643 RepID=UPI0026147208|nr:DUF2157 domain-containing protein [Neptuniibacter sp.]MCP4597890.1 DUF2157 domain-containing protein [Neptuniibacter sp.]
MSEKQFTDSASHSSTHNSPFNSVSSSSDRQTLLQWAAQGLIKAEDLDHALQLIQATPSNQSWSKFISNLLLWLGFIAVGAGVIFFFAFNWQEISNFTKFASIQGLIIITALFYVRAEPQSKLSLATVTLLTLLVGALLALVGQIYQTGADPWQLFAIWALFITPWVLLHRSSLLWLIWVGLINLSILLYLQTFRGLLGFLFRDEELIILFSALNTFFFVSLECGYHNSKKLIQNRIASQIIIIHSGALLSWLALWSIFDHEDMGWAGLCYLIWISTAFYYYRYRYLDLLVLSGIATSLIVVMSGLLIKIFGDAFDGGAFLFISLVIIGSSTAAGVWLKQLYNENKLPQGAQSDE